MRKAFSTWNFYTFHSRPFSGHPVNSFACHTVKSLLFLDPTLSTATSIPVPKSPLALLLLDKILFTH